MILPTATLFYLGAQDCPLNLDFGARIFTPGPGEATTRWRWVYSNGTKGPIQTFDSRKARDIEVHATVRVTHSGTVWTAIERGDFGFTTEHWSVAITCA